MEKIITEAKSIADEYARSWNSIPEEIFNAIIELDPNTNIEKNQLGYIAKQLLLPAYVKGEREFVQLGDTVTSAISEFMRNRNNYPAEFKNITVFPTVKDFVEYVELGEDSDFAKNHAAAEPVIERTPVEKIYDKFYAKDMSEKEFKDIIAADPNSNDKVIGDVAKNLLLPKFVAGDKSILNKLPEIKDAISSWNAHKSAFSAEDVKLTNYATVDDFIKVANSGGESDLIKYLKDNGYWNHVKYLGSTWEYDMFIALDRLGNAAIAGKPVPEHENDTYSNNTRGQWCTTCSSFWDSYRRNGEQYINMMSKTKPTADDRTHNYQFAIRPDGYIREAADGYEHFAGDNSASAIDIINRFFGEDPQAIDVLSKYSPQEVYLLNTKPAQKILLAKQYAQGVFEFNSKADILSISEDKEIAEYVKKLIKRVVIGKNVKIIPHNTFADWSSLTDVEMSDSVTLIGAQAFKNCAIRTLKLPKNIEAINSEAFANCKSLHGTTYLPASLRTIGLRAFYGTDLTLSLSKDRPAGSLNIYSEDEEWYSRHLKLANVANESFEEQLDEELLDENIPPDLARAYKKFGDSRVDRYTFRDNPESAHDEIKPDRNRRHIKYDYANSTYEVVTPEEAMRRVNENRQDVNRIRALFNGQLAEWEWRSGSSIYNMYRANLTREQERTLEEMGYGEVKDQSTKFCNSIKKLGMMLKVADKIYWTDEYDHLITSETPSAHPIKVGKRADDGSLMFKQKVDAEGNPVFDEDGKPVMVVDTEVIDTIAGKRKYSADNIDKYSKYIGVGEYGHQDPSSHNAAANFKSSDGLTFSRINDTGAHKPANRYGTDWNTEDTFYNYTSALKNKKDSFKNFDRERNALKKFEARRAFYDADEYEEIITDITAAKDEAYKNYLEACNKVRKAKDKVLLEMDELCLTYRQKLIRKVVDIQEHLNLIFKLKGQIGKALEKTVSDDDDDDVQEKIGQCNAAINDYTRQIADYQEQLRKIQDAIQELQSKIEGKNTEISDLIGQIDSQALELEKQAEDSTTQIVKSQMELEQQLKAAQDWVTNMIGTKFPRKEKKEFSDALSQILVSTSAFADNLQEQEADI